MNHTLNIRCAFAIRAAALFICASMLVFALAPAAFAESDSGNDNEVNILQTPDSTFLYDTSIYDLDNADASYQGQTVQVTGEVVGDSIIAEEDEGKHWITLDSTDSEKEGSISVLVDDSVLSAIDTYGEYGKTGTTLKVKGTFYLACPTHEGIIDIHADTVSVVERGKTTPEVFDINMFIPGIVACAIGAGLALLFRFLRERQR